MGICTVLHQGVNTGGRALTFGGGTRLQVQPSKYLTLASGQTWTVLPLLLGDASLIPGLRLK